MVVVVVRATGIGGTGNEDGGDNMICLTCISVGPQQQQQQSISKIFKKRDGEDRLGEREDTEDRQVR